MQRHRLRRTSVGHVTYHQHIKRCIRHCAPVSSSASVKTTSKSIERRLDAASRLASLSPPKSPPNRLVEYSVPERALFLRYNYFMSTDTAPFASPSARDKQDSRRAKIAPLLADGMSVRAISAETGIPVGAVHRAKRQLEKIIAQGGQKAAAIAQQLPRSYVVRQDINGVPQDVRRLTVAVYERAVESAIGRGLWDAGTAQYRGPSSARCLRACSMTTRSSGSISADI